MECRQLFAILVAVFFLASPSHAGVNKTNKAFVSDINTVISEVTAAKGAESSEVAELKVIQKEHNKLINK